MVIYIKIILSFSASNKILISIHLMLIPHLKVFNDIVTDVYICNDVVEDLPMKILVNDTIDISNGTRSKSYSCV